jgi:hypothetical protein
MKVNLDDPNDPIQQKVKSATVEVMVEVYKQGLMEGARMLAVWNDGGQFVGVQRKPLSDVLIEVEEERGAWGDIIRAFRSGMEEG